MDRLRTTKLRARRIEMDYFMRRSRFRTWRVGLSLAAIAVAAGWTARAVVRGEPAAPGPLSASHALLASRCEACHDAAVQATAIGARPRWRGASDAACRRCHDVGPHRSDEATSPPCARCHVEHRAGHRPAAAPGACVACHGDLEGTPRVVGADARTIRGFARDAGHPEFAVGPPGARVRLDADPPPGDDAALALNHRLHLAADLRGPSGPVQLRCADCHQADAGGAMAPVSFVRHCASCHPNTFDARFATLPAPHDRPEVVHAFLRGLYVEDAAAHPDARVDARRRVLGGDATTDSAASWASAQTAEAERLLFRDPKRCAECHRLDWGADAGLPTVAPTRVPTRWLPYARFDHGAHAVVACGECHAASASETTADVLLPRADTCRACHHAKGASDRCGTCHAYHRPTPRGDGRGVRELASGGPAS